MQVKLSDDVDQAENKPVAWLYFDGGESCIEWERGDAAARAVDTNDPTIYPLYAGEGQKVD